MKIRRRPQRSAAALVLLLACALTLLAGCSAATKVATHSIRIGVDSFCRVTLPGERTALGRDINEGRANKIEITCGDTSASGSE